MSRNSLSSTRRQLFVAVIALTSVAASVGAASAQSFETSTIQVGSVEERLHASSGRQTDLEIARNRPTQREVAARVSDERSAWSYEQWDAYARSMRGK